MMHYVQGIMLRAESENDAVTRVESFMDEHCNDDGDIGDWCEIGGRWNNLIIGAKAISQEENPDGYKKLFNTLLEWKKEDIEQTIEYIQNETEGNLAILTDGLAGILSMKQKGMVGHNLWKIGAKLAGYHSYDSTIAYLYRDGSVDCSIWGWDDVKELESEDDIWMVIVDIHT